MYVYILPQIVVRKLGAQLLILYKPVSKCSYYTCSWMGNYAPFTSGSLSLENTNFSVILGHGHVNGLDNCNPPVITQLCGNQHPEGFGGNCMGRQRVHQKQYQPLRSIDARDHYISLFFILTHWLPEDVVLILNKFFPSTYMEQISRAFPVEIAMR